MKDVIFAAITQTVNDVTGAANTVSAALDEAVTATAGTISPLANALAIVAEDTGFNDALAAFRSTSAGDDFVWAGRNDKMGYMFWTVLDGEREPNKGFIWDEPYEDILYRQWYATINSHGDTLTVSRKTVKAERVWHASDYDYAENYIEPIGFEEDFKVVLRRKITDLKSFSVERASANELTMGDMSKFGQNRLRYTEHWCIRVETHDGYTMLLSRDQGAEGGARVVAFVLTQMFIGRKLPDAVNSDQRPRVRPPNAADVIDVPSAPPRGRRFDPV